MTDNEERSQGSEQQSTGQSDKVKKTENDTINNDPIQPRSSKQPIDAKARLALKDQFTVSAHQHQTDSIDSDEERERNSTLFSAIRYGDTKKIRELLEKGVKINIIDKNNKDNTLLHYAAEKGKKEVVEELLKWKPDVNAKNINGDTPLDIAVSKGNAELVSILSTNTAEDNITNKNHKTPLNIAKDLKLQNIEEKLAHITISPQTSVEVQTRSQQQTIRIKEKESKENKQPISNKAKKIAIDEGQIKIPCDRRKGTASSGDSYEVHLLILGKIRGEKNTDAFYLDVNVNDVGVFDDIVFRYWKKGISTIILLQAKHIDDTKKNKVTIEKFTNPKNETFYLGKYFLNYLKNREIFHIKSKNPVFQGNFNELDCKFIIYTPAVLDENFNKNKNRTMEVGDCIFSTKSKDNKGMAFKFIISDINSDLISMLEKLSCEMRLEWLAKAVVDCISGKLKLDNMMNNELILTYHVFLAKNLIKVEEEIKIEKNNKYREGKINLDFLSTTDDDRFKTILKENILYEYAKIIFHEKLTPELGDENLVNKLVKSLKETAKIDENLMMTLAGSVLIVDTKKRQLKFADEKKIKDRAAKKFINDLKNEIPTLADYEFTIPNELVKRELKEKRIKLPPRFGNISPSFKKPEHFINNVIIKLLSDYKSQDIKDIKIDDADKKGLSDGDIKNIGQLVGNFLVFDEKDKMLKFANEESLNDLEEGDLKSFIEDLKSKPQLKNLDLNSYRFDIKVKNFPRDTLLVNDEDTVNVTEFLNKLQILTGQANDSDLKEILKDEIRDFYKLSKEEVEDNFLKIRNKAEEHWRNGKYYLRKDCYDDFFSNIVKYNIKFGVKEPVSSFFGREKELDDLHKTIQTGSTVISQMSSISGLGGIGKTELAKMYIKRFSEDYDNNIVWVNAEREGTLSESFTKLAKDKLNIETKDANGQEKDMKCIVEEVYKFFNKRKSLFVFDNAEINEELKNFLPLISNQDNKPYILITSRIEREEWKIWGVKEGITLNVFTDKESINFVKKALEINDGEECQDGMIKELAWDTLHGFPLALQQAVAHIKVENVKLKLRKKGDYTIVHYLNDYNRKLKELLNSNAFKNLDNDYAKTTATTWKVTTDKIKENTEYGQLALDILHIIAYFAPNNIPVEEIFSKLEKDDNKLWEAAELLHKYSMVKLQLGKMDIHRLVQQVIKLELEEQRKEEEILQTGLTLFSDDINENNLNHAVSVWNNAGGYEHLLEEFSVLPSKIIYQLNNSGEYKKGFSLSESFLKTFETLNLKKNKNDLMNGIGIINLKLGKYSEALKIFENILNTDIVDLNMLDVLYNKGTALSHLRKNEDALKTFSLVFEEKKKTLGEKDKTTLTVQLDIGTCLRRLERYPEALNTLNLVYETMKEVNHSEVMSAMNNIGVVHSSMGNSKEAEEIYSIIYNSQKNLRANHSTLRTGQNLAIALAKQGKYEEALKIDDEVIKAQEEVLGVDHLETLRTRSSKAAHVFQLGRLDEAVELLQEIIKKQAKLLPNSQFEILRSKEILADAYMGVGKYDEAMNLLNESYKSRKIVGSSDAVIQNTLRKIKYLESLKRDGQSPLHFSVLTNNERFVRARLNKGDAVNVRNNYNKTPLHLAVQQGNVEVVKLLLNCGADPKNQNHGEETPLDLAKRYLTQNPGNERHKIIELLLRFPDLEIGEIESRLSRIKI